MIRHIAPALFALGILIIVAPAQAQDGVDCSTLAIQTTIKGLDRVCLQDTADEDGVSILRQAIAIVKADSTITIFYEKAQNGNLPGDSVTDLAQDLMDENTQVDPAPVTLAGYEILRFWQPSGNDPEVPCDGALFMRSGSDSERVYGVICRDGEQTPNPVSDESLAEIISATTTPF